MDWWRPQWYRVKCATAGGEYSVVAGVKTAHLLIIHERDRSDEGVTSVSYLDCVVRIFAHGLIRNHDTESNLLFTSYWSEFTKML
jgi:hypothetical protein